MTPHHTDIPKIKDKEVYGKFEGLCILLKVWIGPNSFLRARPASDSIILTEPEGDSTVHINDTLTYSFYD